MPRKWNGVLYVNPGSTELKAINEPHDKFYFIVDTDTWEAEAVPLKTRNVQTVEIDDETGFESFRRMVTDEAKFMSGGMIKAEDRTFFQVIADDSIEDVYKRLATVVHDTGAIARIVVRSNKARDLAPAVDRREENSNMLENAIESRFPKDSDEARLILSMLRSPDPSSIHLICEKYMKGEK